MSDCAAMICLIDIIGRLGRGMTGRVGVEALGPTKLMGSFRSENRVRGRDEEAMV